ncbi:MAG: CHAT domain-containing protein [Proteobacteria bacterium]|nr:CHAT domain-containing protein [Pseudomonadota bacterium]
MRLGQATGGAAAAALALLAWSPSAMGATSPGTVCRPTGPAAPADSGLEQRARAAEATLATRGADGDRGDKALAELSGTSAGIGAAGAGDLAAYCSAAGEAARLARSGSAWQAETYLLAGVRFARAAGDAELEAKAAYRLALATIGGPVVADTRGGGAPARNRQAEAAVAAKPEPADDCAALTESQVLYRPGPTTVAAALGCARGRARAAHDPALAALAALKLSRVLLTAAAAQPANAVGLRAQALAAAQGALPEAEAMAAPGQPELLGRLMEAALDAGAEPSPELDAAQTKLDAAAAENPDEQAYALAMAGRLALARDDMAQARALLGRAAFVESQRAQPLRLSTWLSWLARAEPERRGELATEAYRALEAVRPLLPLVDPLTEEPIFTLRMRPVFEEAVDVELGGSGGAGEAARIDRAQQVVEAYRQAEVQSALGADCVPPRAPVKPAELRPDEVLLYPILLPDRVELIYARGAADGRAAYRRLSVRQGGDRDTVVRLVKALADAASGEEGEGWRAPSQKLYQLLIKPIEGELSPGGTLVIIPDGALRPAPFAALLDDGGKFLVERTAVSIAPALSYSQPGADRKTTPLAVVAASLQKQVTLPAGDFPKLEGTAEEAKIAVDVGGAGARSRLIQDFRKADLQAALADGHVDVLHVATHAAFNGRSDRSFVVANDEAISLTDLRGLISSDRARGDELGLLVLSACETAVGDDQASMGLAGAAVQAGAQSALASLWEVSDAGTVELMKGFYAGYRSGLGKAAALRRAQLKMIAEGGGLEHPGVWAAFTVLGGWR